MFALNPFQKVVLLLGCVLALAFGAYAATAPVITNGPASQTIFYGDPATFRVGVEGALPLSYQWLRDGAVVEAATNAVYTVSQVSSNEQGAGFAVVVTNGFGSVTSEVAWLTVDYGVLGPAQTNRLLNFNANWHFNQNGTNLGAAWMQTNYDDSIPDWLDGPGVFDGKVNNNAPVIRSTVAGVAVGTQLVVTNVGSVNRVRTYYFRTHFNVDPDLLAANGVLGSLRATAIMDDGAVFYVNGEEAWRVGVNDTSYSAWASRTVADPTPQESFLMAATNVVGGDNLLAAEVHQVNNTSSDISFGLRLDAVFYPRVRDTNAPVITSFFPTAGTVVTSLSALEAHFSEGVQGVSAGSLLVNGVPASSVVAMAPDVYVFSFPQPPTGSVQVAWSGSQAITDLSANSNRFAGGSYSYILDPLANARSVVITEFMAGNTHTIRDEDGAYSDWIELYNTASQPVNLGGWYLTDNPSKPAKWRFPAGAMILPKSYLLVWASGNDRTNAAAPLHTSFKLDKGAGNFLGLVFSDAATVVSAFASYPQQYDDVSYGRDRLDLSVTGYFSSPTPGANNTTTGPGFAPEVKFSRASGTFQQAFNLVLSTESTNALIRYVLVTNTATAALTNLPDASSPVYAGPLLIRSSTQVRARAFPLQAGYMPGPPGSETYVQIDAGAASFYSDVPLVLFHNFGGGTPPATADQSGVMMVFGTGYGRACLANPPDTVSRIGINIRGSSTQGDPQSNFAVETWDEFNDDRKIGVLDFPAESDWVFYAPDYFDKPLIHNALMHGLSRSIGRYSSRVRLVEVFASFGVGAVSFISPAGGNYNGVYLIEEKVKAGPGRVDVPRLASSETNAPAITGGYVLKIDRRDADETQFTAGNQALIFVEPQMKDFAAFPGRAYQQRYISNYVAGFYNALMSANWTNPVTGYAAWIQVDSWIDHHLLNVLALSCDALRLSAYLFKDRNEKLEMGPLWDFDRALGTSAGGDWRAWSPRSWMASNPSGNATGTDYGTDYFNPAGVFANPWFSRLVSDPDFWQKWIDRYQELRQGAFSTNAVFGLIDSLAGQLRLAAPREQARWTSGASDMRPRSGWVSVPSGWPDPSFSHYFSGTFQGEIDFLKRWLRERMDFIDTNFLAQPVLSAAAGPVSPPFTVTVTTPNAKAGTTTYYTLDGTDPRLPGGGFAPGARSATPPFSVVVTNNVRLFARNWNPAHRNLTGPNKPPISSSWSGPVSATFVTATPPLAITELMYHPAPPSTGTNTDGEFEFIELKNTGPAPLNLLGMHFTKGLDFTFTATNPITTLGPGQYLVLVANRTAFLSRYPWVTNVAGSFTNRLANAGEEIELKGALKEPILDFQYRDSWYPVTDGAGFSLVIRDENASFDTWTNAASWRASSFVGGSPGQADPNPSEIVPVVINEALTHTDPPEVDTVELYNPTAVPAPIGGWFLTDDHTQPQKFRIPTNTVVAPGGYVTFDATQFDTGAPGSFALSSLGEEVYLFSGDGTNLTGYRHGFEFGAQVNGWTFGRHVTSDGREHFVTQARPTLGAANAGPKIGPIILSEIMYSPRLQGSDKDTRDEYIELRNVTDQPAPLFDPLHSTNSWRLDGGVQFTFPSGVTLAPWSHLLVVNFDPVFDPVMLNWFCSRYGLDPSTPIFGPYQGNLDNQGERVGLYLPDNPQVPPAPDAGFVPYVLAEEVHYSNQPPWPAGADGTGYSLQRLAALGFADDPANWQAAAPTPAALNVGAETIDTDHDGLPDEQEFLAGTDPRDAQDFLRFDPLTLVGPNCRLQFTPKPGRTYTIEVRAALETDSAWTTVVDGITGTNVFTCDLPVTGTTAFYRLKVVRAQ